MKRSLVSLAAMAATGSASAQTTVALFGRVDPGWPAPRDIDPETQRILSDAVDTYIASIDPQGTSYVGVYRFGKTEAIARLGLRGREDFGATMRLQPWQEDILRKVREAPFWSVPYPWVPTIC